MRVAPFDLLMALREIDGLSINPEQTPGFSLGEVEGLIHIGIFSNRILKV
jgi:hypothetical protein